MRAIDKYDVVIVGAGPAGVTAALHSKGDVLLVEKNKEIGVPVRCGEGLFGKITDFFNVEDCVRDAHIVHDVEFCFPKGKRKKITIQSNNIYILNKDKFLQGILKKAMEKKDLQLTVKTDTNASYQDGLILLDGTQVDARVIIDAGGISSQIGRAVGLTKSLDPKDVHVCAQYTVNSALVEPDIIRLFIDKPYSPTGYTWVFPKGDHRANIGMGMLSTQHYDIRRYLDWFINEQYPNCERANYFTAPVCLAPPAEHCVKDNVILTGDAARFCIAMSGAGIGNAMLSGMYAGQVASSYLSGKVRLDAYQKLMEKMLYKKLRRAYRYKEYFMKKDNINHLYRLTSFLFSLHSIAPNTMERFALKNVRF
jgi:digeranylgeranylglycerophospholipid reductase